MKNFISIFYTLPSKIILFILIFIFSFVFSANIINYFTLYNLDKTAFVNVVKQNKNFDYLSSEFYENEIETSIKNVTTLCMKYDELFSFKKGSAEFERFINESSTALKDIFAYIENTHGLEFAVVNHDTKKIYSSIEQINLKSSDFDIRSFFSGDETNLLIARNCKSPYNERGTLQGYNEKIRDEALKYTDDFDLYIFLGNEDDFDLKVKESLERHNAALEKFEEKNISTLLYFFITVFLGIILIIIAGKNEPKGKIYPGELDKVPNDLLFTVLIILIICLNSLFNTSIYMIFQINDVDPEFWLGVSSNFYLDRAKVCICITIMAVIIGACSFKRQRRMGTLVKNTYLYRLYKSVKR
ncbi:MAG: hypothetical protein ACI4GC_05670 [Acutalibacteraceae bacterium]